MNNRKTAYTILIIAIGMFGLAYGFVPLYRLFCEKTGYAGTPGISTELPKIALERQMTVLFDANTSPELEWQFKPQQRQIRLKIGESGLAFYKAVNKSHETIKGTATFTVTPDKAAQYFIKVECFCFNEQTLKPGEEAEFPVTFYIDPQIAEDKNLDDVQTITLSYTFFRVKDGG